MPREELANSIEVIDTLLKQKEIELSSGERVPLLPVLTCNLKVLIIELVAMKRSHIPL